MIGVYSELVSVCSKLGRGDQALDFAERSRSQLFVRLMSARLVRPGATVPEALLSRLDSLREKRLQADLCLATTEAPQRGNSKAFAALQRSLESDTTELVRVLDEIAAYDPAFASGHRIASARVSDWKTIIKPGPVTALVEFVQFANETLLLVVTLSAGGKVDVDESPPADPIRSSPLVDEEVHHFVRSASGGQLVESLLVPNFGADTAATLLHEHWRHFSNPGEFADNATDGIRRIGNVLYDRLLNARSDRGVSLLDLLRRREVRRIVFIPHQLLHLLPLHAAGPDETAGLCLIDEFDVGYAPSLTVLRECSRRRVPASRRLVAVADPRERDPRRRLPGARREVGLIRRHFDPGFGSVGTRPVKTAKIS